MSPKRSKSNTHRNKKQKQVASQARKPRRNEPVVPSPWDEFIGMFEHEPAARDVEAIIAKNRHRWVRVL